MLILNTSQYLLHTIVIAPIWGVIAFSLEELYKLYLSSSFKKIPVIICKYLGDH